MKENIDLTESRDFLDFHELDDLFFRNILGFLFPWDFVLAKRLEVEDMETRLFPTGDKKKLLNEWKETKYTKECERCGHSLMPWDWGFCESCHQTFKNQDLRERDFFLRQLYQGGKVNDERINATGF